MGQKSNPISLRLNINRDFDSCWYQDRHYSKLLTKEIQLRKYIFSTFALMNVHQGRVIFQFFPKKIIIHFFFMNSLSSQKKIGLNQPSNFALLDNWKSLKNKTLFQMAEVLRNDKEDKGIQANEHNQTLPNNPYQKLSLQRKFQRNTLLTETFNDQFAEIIKKIVILFMKHFLYLNRNFHSLDTPQLSLFLFDWFLKKSNFKNVESAAKTLLFKDESQNNKTLGSQLSKMPFLFSKVEEREFKKMSYSISRQSKIHSYFFPVKLSSKYQSAHFISQFVSKSLERNISFREIFKQIQKEIINDSNVLGFRIQCSGRIGGVEMAKVESRKYGQTSLHTFSGKVDFALTEAYTLYGIIGVKVWLCNSI